MNNRIKFSLAQALVTNSLFLIGAVTVMGCTTDTATSAPGQACVETIPGADNADGDFLDAPYVAWMETKVAPLDYTGGFWYDGNGVVIGWSAQEDSEICAY